MYAISEMMRPLRPALWCVDRKRETAQLSLQICSAESTHGTEGQGLAANRSGLRSSAEQRGKNILDS